MSIEHPENKGQNQVASAEHFGKVREGGKMEIPSASDQKDWTASLESDLA